MEVIATVENGATESSDYTERFTITFKDAGTSSFVAVTAIEGVPTEGTVGTDLTLTGTVKPDNATNKTIKWSIGSTNNAGASISSNQLSATKAGAVEVIATVENGATESSDYTERFTITFKVSSRVAARSSIMSAPAMTNAMLLPNISAQSRAFVTNITLPTQQTEAGTDFDLSQANVEASGEKDFTIDWIVGRGFAEMPDNHTVRMDTPGQVTMTAVVVDGNADGSVYTQDFVITFTQPSVTEPEEMTPIMTEREPEEMTPIMTEPEREPEEMTPIVTEPEREPEEMTPIITEPEQEPEEMTPIITEPEREPEEMTPIVTEPEREPEEMTPIITKPEREPEEMTPIIPQQQPEEILNTEVTIPITPIDTPVSTSGPSSQQNVMIQSSDILISVMGSTVTNSDIVLVAKNPDGILYDNAVWSIINDGGTLSSLSKNVLRAEKKGVVTVRVAVGNGIPKFSTKVITIR